MILAEWLPFRLSAPGASHGDRQAEQVAHRHANLALGCRSLCQVGNRKTQPVLAFWGAIRARPERSDGMLPTQQVREPVKK